MCFLLNMYNVIVKNRGKYSFCDDNLCFVKSHNRFSNNQKMMLVSDGIDKNCYIFT